MTTSAGDDLAVRVRRRLTGSAAPVTRAAVVTAVRAETHAAALGDAEVLRVADGVHGELVGAGALAPLLADPAVTDVLVNGTEVWADRGSGLVCTGIVFDDAEQVRVLAQRLAAASGRRLDDGSPYADARLPDGTRVHAVLPPVAVTGPYLSLRTFRARPFTLTDLRACGTVDAVAAEVLHAVVRARLAYLVVGGTGTGKTTLLATLLGLVPGDERIVVVEDAAELHPVHPHVVTLQTRPANVEGAGAVSLRDLVRQALRMRPDRLVVGECRGGEVVEMLGALNTGHDGGAATLHANTAADVPARLAALGTLGGLAPTALHTQAAAAIQVVVELRRTGRGRCVESIGVLSGDGARGTVVRTAWHRRSGAGAAATALTGLLRARGVEAPGGLVDPR
ncbi:MAG TPA: TadA family conjugal transfer-associated ATPase [Pilimelia sp.]|nr:TadA family conjugal transfer-associated ATPase [Pilimelia sp.]